MILHSAHKPGESRACEAIKAGAEGANTLRWFAFIAALFILVPSCVQAQSSSGLSNYTRLLMREAQQEKQGSAQGITPAPLPKPVSNGVTAVPAQAPANAVAAPMDRREMLVRIWDEAISNGWVTARTRKPTDSPAPAPAPPPQPQQPKQPPAAPGPASTNGGLVLYLPFEEGKGTVAHDASGYGWVAEASPKLPVVWAGGIVGTAISTVNSNLFRIPHTNSLSGLKEFSFSFWINSTSAVETESVWISKHSGGTKGEFLVAGMSTNLIRWTLVNSSAQRINLEGKCASWNDGKWHHVAGSFNGNAMALWLDNVPVSNAAFKGPLNSYESPIIIGDYDFARFGYASFQYSGLIDEVKIWNRAISPDEVRQLSQR